MEQTVCEPSIKSINPTAPIPYVFAVGCPRSGTTLLQRMLDHHPLLAVANDTHFIPRALAGMKVSGSIPLTPGLVERVRSYRRFPRLGLSDEAISRAANKSATYREFVSGLYTEFASQRGKPLAGEKTPDYVKCLPVLHGLFPEAKVIHIIRDGRDTALSLLGWATETKGPGKFRLWMNEPVAVCALWWAEQVRSGLRDGRPLGPSRYLEVSYEKLVQDPEEHARNMSRFLALPYSDQMLRYHEGKVRDNPNLSAKSRWLPPTPGLRDWRRDLKDRDIELFEALVGDLLTDLGYERVAKEPSPRIVKLAIRCREAWTHETSQRKRNRDRPYKRDSSQPVSATAPRGSVG